MIITKLPNLAMLTVNNKHTTEQSIKSYQKYIKITQENLFHRNSLQSCIVPIPRYIQPLPRLRINFSKIVNTYHPINITHFYKLCIEVQNEILCTKHITVFFLGNSFPIVLYGQVHYTSQHNTIGKQFPQEKTIIERCF
jgi:hypothetical protein